MVFDCIYIYIYICLQAKFECALKHSGIKIVTPDWITDSVKGNISAGSLMMRFIKLLFS